MEKGNLIEFSGKIVPVRRRSFSSALGALLSISRLITALMDPRRPNFLMTAMGH